MSRIALQMATDIAAYCLPYFSQNTPTGDDFGRTMLATHQFVDTRCG